MNALMILAQAVTMIWGIAFVTALFGREFWRLRGGDRLEMFWRAAARAHQELWPFAAPGYLINVVTIWNSDMPFMIVIQVGSVLGWWFGRNWPDDENRWKRRGKRAAEKIAEKAGRLIVVPA